MTSDPETENSSQTKRTVPISAMERLLAGCKRIDLELPDFGIVKIYPYISSGAMSAASLSIDKKSNLLRAIFEESIIKDQVKSGLLTDADWIAVANHFLRSIDAETSLSTYLENGDGITEGFRKCFVESSEWKETEEGDRKLRAALEREMRPHIAFAEAFQRTIEPLIRSSIVDMPPAFEFHGYRDPIWEMAKSAGALSAISLPSFDFLGPDLSFLKTIEDQFAEIRQIQNVQVSDIVNFERLTALPVFPKYDAFESLSALDSVIGNAVERTSLSNAYFSSKEYLSPFRLRRDLRSKSIDDSWVDEVEEVETAIVVETLTKQNAVDVVVRQRLKQFEAEKRLNELPELERRVRALEAGATSTDFMVVLERFGKRVAGHDYRMFWSEYGNRFQANPETIGKYLLGLFLEGHARGNGFVAHEICTGEGFVDVIVYLDQQTFIIELKIVGCGWGFGKAELGLNQLDYYDKRFESAELFLVVFDGRKTTDGKQIAPEYELSNGKRVKGISIPIYSDAPTSVHRKQK